VGASRIAGPGALAGPYRICSVGEFEFAAGTVGGAFA
jgi:hypothetical protein